MTPEEIVRRLEAAKNAFNSELDVVLQAIAAPEPLPMILVRQGDNLPALAAEKPAGTIFSIEAAFSADVSLIGDKPYVLRSATLPGPVRVGRDLAGPTLRGEQTFKAAIGAFGIRFVGKNPNSTVITAGPGTTLDRILIQPSATGQRRGIAANAPNVTIERVYVDDLWHSDEPQAVAGWSKTRNLRVTDSYLGASGENMMLGGADPASEDDIPQDVFVENCSMSKPVSWKGKSGVTVKNHVELKNAKRVTIKNCVLENCWLHAQSGYSIVLTVRNQGGNAPFSTIQDVLLEDITIRHVGAGINILGRDDMRYKATHPRAIADPSLVGHLYPSIPMRNVVLRRIKIEDLDRSKWGDATRNVKADGRTVQIAGGPSDLTLENFDVSGSDIHSALFFHQLMYQAERFAVRDSRFIEGTYGIFGDGVGLGVPVLTKYAPGATWERIKVVRPGAAKSSFPTGTEFVTA
jgi:hypothetical protein